MQSKIYSLSMKSTNGSTNLLMEEMIYEMNQILNCGHEIKWSKDPRRYERNFSYCVEKPEKLERRTDVTGPNPVIELQVSQRNCSKLCS